MNVQNRRITIRNTTCFYFYIYFCGFDTDAVAAESETFTFTFFYPIRIPNPQVKFKETPRELNNLQAAFGANYGDFQDPNANAKLAKERGNW